MPGNKHRLLITGGLGNLGSWVTEHFALLPGYDVTVLAHSDRELLFDAPYRKIFADVGSLSSLRSALEGQAFDFVIHLASVNESFVDNYAERALLINAGGTRNLLELCAAWPVKKFIYLSTFHVYGKDGGEISESDTPAPRNDYAITHLFAEQYVRMMGERFHMPWVIFRLSNSYGCPKDRHSSKWYLLFNDLCRQAVQQGRMEIRSNGKALRDFIYMGDVCDVLDQALSNDAATGQVFNLGSGESLSLEQLASQVEIAYKEVYQKDLPLHKNEKDNTPYPSVLHYNIVKLKSCFHIKPASAYQVEAKKIFRVAGGDGTS